MLFRTLFAVGMLAFFSSPLLAQSGSRPDSPPVIPVPPSAGSGSTTRTAPADGSATRSAPSTGSATRSAPATGSATRTAPALPRPSYAKPLAPAPQTGSASRSSIPQAAGSGTRSVVETAPGPITSGSTTRNAVPFSESTNWVEPPLSSPAPTFYSSPIGDPFYSSPRYLRAPYPAQGGFYRGGGFFRPTYGRSLFYRRRPSWGCGY